MSRGGGLIPTTENISISAALSADKENMTTSSTPGTQHTPHTMSAIPQDLGITSPPKRLITSSTASTMANVRSDINRFTQRVEQSNEAYEQHAQGLTALLSNINKNVYKIHTKGPADGAMPARFAARLALGSELAKSDMNEFDL